MTPALFVGLALLSAPAPLPKGAVARVTPPLAWRASPQLAPTGDRLAVLAQKRILIIDVATGATREIMDADRTRYHNPHNKGSLTVAFVPAGSELFVGNYTSAVPVYDPRTGKHLRDVPVPLKKAQFPGKPDEPSLVWEVHPTPAAGGVLLFTTGTGAERLLAKDQWVALGGGGGWVTSVTRNGRFVGTVDTQARPCGHEVGGLGMRRPWQASGIGQAAALLAGHRPAAVVADEGHNSQARVERIEARGATAVTPTQRTQKAQRVVDPDLYRERNLVERFWSRAKPFRRVATRHDTKAANFLAFAKVAAVMVMLK